MIRNFILPSALVIALIAALAAGDRGAGVDTDSVAAMVNGEKIRARQVEAFLAQAAPGAGEDARASREALERIIDQELLAQEARKAGLERDPRVAEAIEAARAAAAPEDLICVTGSLYTVADARRALGLAS